MKGFTKSLVKMPFQKELAYALVNFTTFLYYSEYRLNKVPSQRVYDKTLYTPFLAAFDLVTVTLF